MPSFMLRNADRIAYECSERRPFESAVALDVTIRGHRTLQSVLQVCDLQRPPRLLTYELRGAARHSATPPSSTALGTRSQLMECVIDGWPKG